MAGIWERFAAHVDEVLEAEGVADYIAVDISLEELIIRRIPAPEWASERWPLFTEQYRRYCKVREAAGVEHPDPVTRYNFEESLGRFSVKTYYAYEVLGFTGQALFTMGIDDD